MVPLFCFALPAPSHKGKRILEARDLDRIPWSILLLFGAGFALAAAFQSSGLSQQAGSLLQSIRPENVFLMILLINFSVTNEGLEEQLLGLVVEKEIPDTV